MKKILFLSSAFIMTTLGAYAADEMITGGAGTCTVDVLGVSDNNATANTIATWSLNDYKCGAGQYLDEDTLTCTTCPAGSYCPGGTFTIENASSGTFDCPAGYTESAAGAGTNNECYTACTVANANIEHATAVSGNDYYGTTDADTCTATNCELGYHVDGGEIELVEKTPVIPVDYETAGNGNYAYINPDGSSDFNGISEDALTANGTWVSEFDYGRVYGRASCQPSADPASVYVINNLGAIIGGSKTMDELRTELTTQYGQAKANAMVDSFELAMSGAEDVYTNEANFETFAKYVVMLSESPDKNYATDSTGEYCYCQMDGFAPATDGALGEKSTVTSAPWVFLHNRGSAGACASYCARDCADDLQNDDVNLRAFRAAMFGAFDAVETGGMCKVTETDCPAGQYLAVVGDAMMCVPCKSGSYCPGGVYTIESENKGTNACPTTHPNSDAGAGADTQCYTACTLETANIAHATAVSGNDYYGTGTDTCTATACDTGYHVDGDIEIIERTPLIPVDYRIGGDERDAAIEINGETYSDYSKYGLTVPGTWAGEFDYGIVYGRASCQPYGTNVVGDYVLITFADVYSGKMSLEEWQAGLEPLAGKTIAEFATEIVAGALNGTVSDAERYRDMFALFGIEFDSNYQIADAGDVCYCQIDGFAPMTDGVLKTKRAVMYAPWVYSFGFQEEFNGAGDCAADCASYCAYSMISNDDPYDRQNRAALYGVLDYTETATCAANTINIDWNPDNGGAHTQNMCYYDGEITLPDEPVKVGYTFSGWKLVEPNSTPVQ